MLFPGQVTHPFDHGGQTQNRLEGNSFRTGLATIASSTKDFAMMEAKVLKFSVSHRVEIIALLKYLPILIEERLLFSCGNNIYSRAG